MSDKPTQDPNETSSLVNRGSIDLGVDIGSVTYVTESGILEEEAEEAILHGDVAKAMHDWLSKVGNGARARAGSDIFKRDKYQTTDNQFKTMAQCAHAVEYDDVLSTLADTSEGLALPKMHFEMYDEDEEDIWNQIAADLDFDSLLRKSWRELYKVSAVNIGVLWGRREYQVRTPAITEKDVDELQSDLVKTAMRERELWGAPAAEGVVEGEDKRGNRNRRKKYKLKVPIGLTIIDPTKVLPVGQLMFGLGRYAYIASDGEHEAFLAAASGDIRDGLVPMLLEGQYSPTETEKGVCANLGVSPERLWLFHRDALIHHTLTKADYERFAPLRLRPAIELLDMKGHLRSSDRAALIGATNFIVVITKGSDKLPAHPEEIENLQEQVRVVARMPILVGDHRLDVKIVSPNLDMTLNDERWNVLDSRLVFKALQSFSPYAMKGSSTGSSTVNDLSKIVSLGMESRRHQLVRALERGLFRAVLDKNDEITEMPHIEFSPRRISLDWHQVISQTLLKLRDRGDISRETVLQEYDYDQETELKRRMREHRKHDRVFRSQVPHSSPQSSPFGPPGDEGRPAGVTEDEPREPADG